MVKDEAVEMGCHIGRFHLISLRNARPAIYNNEASRGKATCCSAASTVATRKGFGHRTIGGRPARSKRRSLLTLGTSDHCHHRHVLR